MAAGAARPCLTLREAHVHVLDLALGGLGHRRRRLVLVARRHRGRRVVAQHGHGVFERAAVLRAFGRSRADVGIGVVAERLGGEKGWDYEESE